MSEETKKPKFEPFKPREAEELAELLKGNKDLSSFKPSEIEALDAAVKGEKVTLNKTQAGKLDTLRKGAEEAAEAAKKEQGWASKFFLHGKQRETGEVITSFKHAQDEFGGVLRNTSKVKVGGAGLLGLGALWAMGAFSSKHPEYEQGQHAQRS